MKSVRQVLRTALLGLCAWATFTYAADVDRSPLQLAVSPDGKWLYTANRTSDSVSRIDLASGKVVGEFTAGRGPTGVAVSPDGKRLYVANRLDDTLTVLDSASGKRLRSVSLANQPYDVAVGSDGTVYVTCLGKDEVVQAVDPESLAVTVTIPVDQNPRHIIVSRNGKRLYVTCDAYDPTRWLDVIDLATSKVIQRIPFPMSSNLRDVAEVAPNVLIVTHLNPNPFTPLTQVQQGWVNANGFSFVFLDEAKPQPVMLLLDEFTRAYANPYGIAVTPDGQRAFIACGGVDEVVVVDLSKALELVKRTPREKRNRLRSKLSLSRQFLAARIPVGTNPYGLAASPDGKRIYVANHLGNSVSVLDVATHQVVGTIDVGSAPAMSKLRRGEILFNSAALCFQRQFSCASCHPEGHTTGLSWDLEDDGLGNPKNIRSFRGVQGTAPFRWQGEAAEIGANECGPTVTGAMRGSPLPPSDLEALAAYVEQMPLMPNPYRGPKGELSEAARRGKAIFEGDAGCAECHTPGRFTSRERFAVGLGPGRPDDLELPGGETIAADEFDVPQLLGVWDSPPYLHDGRARTLEEIFTRFNPDDEHGSTSDLNESQLRDLIEYLKSL